MENSVSLGPASLGTETDSDNDDETGNVLPLKGSGFQWYTERGVIKNDLWREVATVWDLDQDYTGSYREDYQILQNTFHEGQRTCWIDKYSTIIFNPDIECELATTLFTVQPVPY